MLQREGFCLHNQTTLYSQEDSALRSQNRVNASWSCLLLSSPHAPKCQGFLILLLSSPGALSGFKVMGYADFSVLRIPHVWWLWSSPAVNWGAPVCTSGAWVLAVKQTGHTHHKAPYCHLFMSFYYYYATSLAWGWWEIPSIFVGIIPRFRIDVKKRSELWLRPPCCLLQSCFPLVS